ncbi:hypothetical protein GGR50DRAFT_694340 [Xylaria sp. CBS 124048]|nr:hypothetical protein GGR50DRAFT_694340 [Xylaria sp. CBS 124048]
MCQIYRQIFSVCGHAGRTQVTSRCCIIGRGPDCFQRTWCPVRSTPGKCTGCERKDAQAWRYFGDNARRVSDADVALAAIRFALRHRNNEYDRDDACPDDWPADPSH